MIQIYVAIGLFVAAVAGFHWVTGLVEKNAQKDQALAICAGEKKTLAGAVAEQNAKLKALTDAEATRKREADKKVADAKLEAKGHADEAERLRNAQPVKPAEVCVSSSILLREYLERRRREGKSQ